MIDFSYAAAHTVDEAVSLLAAAGDQARVLAGGTDILVQLREGMRTAELVVDVKRIPQLSTCEFHADGSVVLGAAVPCVKIYGEPRFQSSLAALVDSARIIGGWQIQSRASVGGNLCNSSPAADGVPSLMVLGAVAVVAGPEGVRRVPVGEFCTGPGRNVLTRGEFLVSLEFPAPLPRSGSAYLRFIPRNEMDIAVVGVGAWVELDATGRNIEAARIALGAVAPTAVMAREAARWIAGQPATSETFAEAGRRARAAATPITDRRAPAEYRTHLVGVLTERVLSLATDRARQTASGNGRSSRH